MQFNQKSKVYNQNAMVQKSLIHWGSDWLEDTLKDLSALEFGAGTGMLTEHLVNREARTLATDLSPLMVQEGKVRCPEASWQVMDAWDPQLPRYDRLYSASLLQWAEHPTEVLKKWKACLSPGGRLFCLFFIDPSLPELRSIAGDVFPLSWRSQEAWEGYFREAGWSILRSNSETAMFTFPTAIDFLYTLHGIGATRRNDIGAPKLRRIINTYEENFRGDEGVQATWTFFKIECSRDT